MVMSCEPGFVLSNADYSRLVAACLDANNMFTKHCNGLAEMTESSGIEMLPRI
jgi:hypothetical protein